MGALIPITDRAESARAFRALKDTFTRGAICYPNQSIGWQGGSVRLEAHWRRKLGIWGAFEHFPPTPEPPKWFWNLFGVDDPGVTGSLSIAVQMNPPHEHENGRLAGVFLRDERGRQFIGHTGRIGGGKKGVGQKAFRCHAREMDWQEFISRKRTKRLVVTFGPLDSDGWVPRLAEYVKLAAQFKADVDAAAKRSDVSRKARRLAIA